MGETVRNWVIFSAVAACVAVLPGCGGTNCKDPQGTYVRFSPSADLVGDVAADWLRFPYPNDLRRADGSIDMSDFPNPNDLALVSDVIDTADTLGGFSTTAAIHLSFSGPITANTLTTSGPGATMQLVDITPGSTEFGKRWPLRYEYDAVGDAYTVPNNLSVAPAWGYPLRERATYAFLLTDGVMDASGMPLEAPPLLQGVLEDSGAANCDDRGRELAAIYDPLRTLLADEGLDPGRIVAATVFTTQDITGEMQAIRDVVHTLPAPPLLDSWQMLGVSTLHDTMSFQWNAGGSMVDFYVMEGALDVPNFQQGMIPYSSVGGGFEYVDGVPVVARTERIRFVLTIPVAPPADAGPCYPIVQYSHGTGGDAFSFTGSTAGRLAARGLAGISIEQPLHGGRKEGMSFDESLASFNFINPVAGRTNFRQGAADTFSLTRFVRESLMVPANRSPTAADICFDPARTYFFGHSQGGLTGAIAASVEEDVNGWIFSGAGGGFSITIMERKDLLDFEGLVGLIMFELNPGELSELHPAMTLLQTVVDVTDPANYAPYWTDLVTNPTSVMLTNGTLDPNTPFRTADTLAVSAALPQVTPIARTVPEYEDLDVAPASAPVSGNIGGQTAGYLQWTSLGGDASHFVIFRRPEAINASMRFFETAAYEGGAVIERDPSSDAR